MMTARKKTGVVAIIVAALSGVGGILMIAGSTDPGWWPIVTQLVTVIAGVFGFSVVYPDTDE
jgi:TctA family transporter